MAAGTPTCVWRVDAALVELLDAALGPPLDSYVRGWQVWLEDNGPDGVRLEWRLHPPAGFRLPRGIDATDLFDVVLQEIAEAPDGQTLAAWRERRGLSEIWEVLEAFPADGDPVEVEELAGAVTGVLRGRAPDAAGLADHQRLGELWKGRRGDFSVGAALLEALAPWPPPAGGIG